MLVVEVAGPLSIHGSAAATLAGGPSWRRYTVLLVLGVTVIRVIAAILMDLVPDETYYWSWSEQLAAGYYDHPPAVAWVIAATTAIAGDTVIGVRLAAILCAALTSVVVYTLACDMFGDRRAGFFAVLVASCMPLMQAGAIIITPDTPQALAWALALLAIWRATTWGRKGWWLWTGAAVGAALLSKYIALLFGVCAVVWVVLDKDARAQLKTAWPYVGAVLAFAFFAPVVWWNASHEWVSFKFQLGHGLGAHRKGGFMSLLEYLGGQVAIMTPVFFVLVATTWFKRDRAFRFLMAFSVPVILMFCIAAWRGPTEANWPSPAYLAVALALGGLWVRGGSKSRAWLKAGVACAVVATSLAHIHLITPVIDVPRDRIRQRVTGWEELGDAIDLQHAASGGTRVFVYTDSYQLASEMAFYGPGSQVVWVWPGASRRVSQYDMWERPEFQPGDEVIYVAGAHRRVPEDLRVLFGRVDEPSIHPLPGIDRHGNPRNVHMFGVRDYLGSLAMREVE